MSDIINMVPSEEMGAANFAIPAKNKGDADIVLTIRAYDALCAIINLLCSEYATADKYQTMYDEASTMMDIHGVSVGKMIGNLLRGPKYDNVFRFTDIIYSFRIDILTHLLKHGMYFSNEIASYLLAVACSEIGRSYQVSRSYITDQDRAKYEQLIYMLLTAGADIHVSFSSENAVVTVSDNWFEEWYERKSDSILYSMYGDDFEYEWLNEIFPAIHYMGCHGEIMWHVKNAELMVLVKNGFLRDCIIDSECESLSDMGHLMPHHVLGMIADYACGHH